MWDSSVLEMLGDPTKNGLEAVIKENTKTKERFKHKCDGVFLGIGHKPNSDLFSGILDLDDSGYIITKPDSTKTSDQDYLWSDMDQQLV